MGRAERSSRTTDGESRESARDATSRDAIGLATDEFRIIDRVEDRAATRVDRRGPIDDPTRHRAVAFALVSTRMIARSVPRALLVHASTTPDPTTIREVRDDDDDNDVDDSWHRISDADGVGHPRLGANPRVSLATSPSHDGTSMSVRSIG